MSDPEFFEVQRAGEVRRKGFWDTTSNSMSHADALAERERQVRAMPGARFRVVPFGTGPNDFEPGDDAPDYAKRAYAMVADRVLRMKGNADDIVRHGDGFRYYTGDQAEPIIGAGWEEGRQTEAGFQTDVTAGGGC